MAFSSENQLHQVIQPTFLSHYDIEFSLRVEHNRYDLINITQMLFLNFYFNDFILYAIGTDVYHFIDLPTNAGKM